MESYPPPVLHFITSSPSLSMERKLRNHEIRKALRPMRDGSETSRLVSKFCGFGSRLPFLLHIFRYENICSFPVHSGDSIIVQYLRRSRRDPVKRNGAGIISVDIRIIDGSGHSRRGGRSSRALDLIREEGMERVDGRDVALAVEEEQVLQGLLARAQQVDNVLREAAADEGRHGAQLAAQVLQEAAQELRREGGDVKLELAVALVGQLGEQLQVRAREGREPPAGEFLELPQRAEAGQQWGDGSPLARVAGEVFGQGGGVCEDERGVDLPLRHHLDNLLVLLLGRDAEDAPRRSLLRRGGNVGLFALDHEVVHDQVREDVAVESMETCGVEGPVGEAAGRIDCREGWEVQLGRDDHVEARKELWRLRPDVIRVDVYLDTGVHVMNLGARGLGTLSLPSALIHTCHHRWRMKEKKDQTFWPTCSSVRKNCAPRSSSVTTSWSRIVSDPMPANTRFLATSLANARMVISRMLADRNLG